MDTTNGTIGQARQALDEAQAAYAAAQRPITDLEARAAQVRAQLPELEARAARIDGPLEDEIALEGTKRRAERIEAEIDRLRDAARPAAQAVGRDQERLDQLEQESYALAATHRILVDLTHPDVLQLTVADWMHRLGLVRERLTQLTGAAPPASPYDDVAAAHVEQLRLDNERQAQYLAHMARASETRQRVQVGG